jgi:hypothetical protein
MRQGKRTALAGVLSAIMALGTATSALAGTVTYDLNGPAGVVHEHTEIGDVTVEEIGTDFLDLGELTSWNTRRDGTGDSYAVGDPVAGDVTLYAQYSDGTLLARDLTQIDGKWYLYVDGTPVTGKQPASGALMYFDAADGGARVEDGWVEDGEATYHVTEGELDTGLTEVGGRTYALDDEGNLMTGIVELDGKRYAAVGEAASAEQGGYLAKDGWAIVGEDRYYALADGTLVTSTTMTIDGISWSFDAAGIASVEQAQPADGEGSDNDASSTVESYPATGQASYAATGFAVGGAMLFTSTTMAAALRRRSADRP